MEREQISEKFIKYQPFSDEELIGMLRDGDRQVEDYLMDKYKNLVRKKANSMYLIGGETEDLIQEGMIGLIKAVRDYDFGRDASFFTFAELCISRQIYTAIQSSNRKKHWPLNTYVSIYAPSHKEGHNQEKEQHTALGLSAMSGEVNNPENIVIAQENVEEIEMVIETQLSELEKQVLQLHMIGINYVEIAKILGRDEKSTDNALQRTKQKLKKALKK